MSLGLGIIGCGMISNFHAKAIADTDGAELVACFDRNVDAAKQFGSDNQITAFETLDELLDDPKVDLVTICTPSGAHLEPCLAAAGKGKHVIVEKPLEITVERCDQMINACEKAGVVLSTIFPSRFHHASVLLKTAIDSGRFGKLTLGDAYVKWFRTQEYYDSGQWRGTWALDGGGALMNQAIHSVDMVTWLMGPVKSVSATTATLAHERIEVEDVCVANIQFCSGALGVLEATTAAFPGSLKKIQIHGSSGSATLEEESITEWAFAVSSLEDEQILAQMRDATKTGGGAADPSAIGHAGHAAQFQDVVNAIKEGRQPAICGREGRRSVEIIEAIYSSAKSGQRIEL